MIQQNIPPSGYLLEIKERSLENKIFAIDMNIKMKIRHLLSTYRLKLSQNCTIC